MGPGLEMTMTFRFRRAAGRTLAALSLAALAACSGGTGNQSGDAPVLLQAARAKLAELAGGGEAGPDARAVLTPALVAGSPTPLILMLVEETDTALTLVPRASNRGTVQWRDVGGGGILRRDGILVGTRGFGFDLHTADIAPLAAALRRGGGEGVERINRYIDGQNQIVAVQFLCSVRPLGGAVLERYGTRRATTVFEEDCEGAGVGGFVNRYWIDSRGVVQRTQELIHPRSGAVTIDLLVE
jgi:hypothetical protein